MNNNIKNSQYNIFVDDKEQLLIFNTLTKNLIAVPTEKAQRVHNALKKADFSKLTEKELKSLIDERFIVDSTIDESDTAIIEYNKIIYDNTSLNLVIIPTMSCNFDCIYCPQKHENAYMSDEVVNSIINFVKRNVNKLQKIMIEWFGGEPLLCKKTVIKLMKEISEICNKNKILLISSMTTNGYELDLDTFNELVKYGVRYYQISIDGNQFTHNKMRPHKVNSDSFEKIVSNLTAIKNNSNCKRVSIGIRINVSTNNYCEIDDLIKFYYSLFSNDNRFKLMWQWVRDWGGAIEKQEARENLKSHSEICRKFYQYCVENNLNCVDYMSCRTGQNICEACKINGFVINYNGNIYKCAMMLDHPEMHEQNKIGVLEPQGKMNVDINKIAKWIVTKSPKNKCRTCSSFPQCMGVPCPLSVNIKSKDICVVDKSLNDLHIRNIAKKTQIKVL